MNSELDTWEEWMGYRVHYVLDGVAYVQDSTSYGVSYGRATQVMKSVLLQGFCAWIVRMKPDEVEEIPF